MYACMYVCMYVSTYAHTDLDLEMHSLGGYMRLQSGRLQSGRLHVSGCRFRIWKCIPWKATVWEATVWEATGLRLSILDLDMHSTAETIYRTLQPKCCLGNETRQFFCVALLRLQHMHLLDVCIQEHVFSLDDRHSNCG